MAVSPLLDETSLTSAERATVERLVAGLEDSLGEQLVAVWLYGSRARGEEPKPESDVDLIVITHDGRDDWERAYQALTEAAAGTDASAAFFSLKVFDPDWVRGRRRIADFFIQEVDRDKVVLAGAP